MADDRKKKPAEAGNERVAIPLDAEVALRALMQVAPESGPNRASTKEDASEGNVRGMPNT